MVSTRSRFGRIANLFSGNMPKRRTARRQQNLRLERLENRQLLAGIVWADGPQLITPRADASAVSTPSQILLIGGGSSTVEKLSATSTNWISSYVTPKNPTDPAVETVGGHVLVYGGRYSNQATEEAFEYDLAFGDSQDISNLPTPRSAMASAGVGSNNAYAIGGIDGNSVFDTVEQYDYANDTWTEMTPLPSARTGAVAISDDDGHVLVFGGATNSAGTTLSSTVYAYDISSDSWSTRAPMPIATTESGIGMDSSGHIYIVGGKSSAGAVAAVQVYDAVNDSWSSETDLPQPVYSAAVAVDALDRLVVIGGRNSAGTVLASVTRSQPLNLPDVAPVITSYPVLNASADKVYTYDVNASGNPPPNFSLVASPAGMTIDPVSGVITWQPIDTQVGNQGVTVRATNRAGAVDHSFTIAVVGDTTPPTAPLNMLATNVTESTVDLSWDASTDAKGVDHYTVFKGYSCGWRGRNTCYATFLSNVVDTSVTLSGLSGNYKLRVAAFDEAGNKSAYSDLAQFSMLYGPKIVYFQNSGYRTPSEATANFAMSVQVYGTGNPTPELSMVSGPTGMTFDAATGKVLWTPSPDDVGSTTAVFAATNSVGIQQLVLPITVTPDVPALAFQFNPNTGSKGYAVSGELLEIQTNDLSHTTSTFEIVSGPSTATIDPITGLIQWTPTVQDAGPTTFVVRGTNAAGVTERSVPLTTYFSTSPTGLTVTDTLALHPTLTWTTPVGVGSAEIAGYDVLIHRRYRSGRAMRTEQFLLHSTGAGTSLELTGMKENVTYNVYVTPYNADGLRGVRSTEVVTFVHRPSLPSVGWTIEGFGGTSSIVAGQPMSIQFTDKNASSVGTTFEIIDAPAGFTLDPTTGLAQWTPSLSNVTSTNSVSIRATNTLGLREYIVPINVFFTGPVVNLTAIKNGSFATATWDPPTTNAEPIAFYRITQHFSIGGRPRTRVLMVTGTSTSVDVPLVPTGAVNHTGVTITAINAAGLSGLSSHTYYI